MSPMLVILEEILRQARGTVIEEHTIHVEGCGCGFELHVAGGNLGCLHDLPGASKEIPSVLCRLIVSLDHHAKIEE